MSKVKSLFVLVGYVVGTIGAVAGVRAATDKQDKLLVVKAGASALAAATGVLLTLRSLRSSGESEGGE
jgi:hypothetical protein